MMGGGKIVGRGHWWSPPDCVREAKALREM